MSLRLARTAKLEKFSGRNFVPGGAAQRLEVVLRAARQRTRHGKVSDPQAVFQPPDDSIQRHIFGEFDHDAVARFSNAFHVKLFQRPAQGQQKFAEEKIAIPPLEPKLMVVNHDDRLGHGYGASSLLSRDSKDTV